MEKTSALHLDVRTESGQHLGVVVDVQILVESQTIHAYVVRAHRLLPAAVNQELIIHRTQVVGIDDRGLIVEDATTTATAASPAAI